MKPAELGVRLALGLAVWLGMMSVACAQVSWTEHAPVTATGSTVTAFGSISWTVGYEVPHGSLMLPMGQLEPGLLHAIPQVADCVGDLNGDQTITTSDLLILLSTFGTLTDGPADFTGDGLVGTTDLLVLLSVFGTSCP